MATRSARVLAVLIACSSAFLSASTCLSAETVVSGHAQEAFRAAMPASPFQIGAYDPERDAEQDLREAVALAGTTGRRVLMSVGGEWCVWCRRLDTLLTTDPVLRTYRDSSYVMLKVNWGPENKNVRLLSKYPRIPGYPHFFVLEADGTFLYSQGTGELEKGKRHDAERIMAFLKAWAPPGRSGRK